MFRARRRPSPIPMATCFAHEAQRAMSLVRHHAFENGVVELVYAPKRTAT